MLCACTVFATIPFQLMKILTEFISQLALNINILCNISKFAGIFNKIILKK